MKWITARLTVAAFCLGSVAAGAQYDIDTRLPTCATLQWSPAVHASYPDIDKICQGVYQRDGVLYARAQVDVVRVTGNRMTLRTVHVDGSAGHETTLRVGPKWRALIDGKSMRAGELITDQRLTVYIPQDRFALRPEGGEGVAEGPLLEEVTEPAKPADQQP